MRSPNGNAKIAELVSTGRTNREIAVACHLSEKTIERHVSHIIAKLEVSIRTAVAGIIARHRERSEVAVEGIAELAP